VGATFGKSLGEDDLVLVHYVVSHEFVEKLDLLVVKALFEAAGRSLALCPATTRSTLTQGTRL
jgi:hypothetical protein